MRFVLVVAIWIVIVGGLWLYIWQRDSAVIATVVEKPVVTLAGQRYALEITPTFSVEADPFALDTGESGQNPLELRLNGGKVLLSAFQFKRGQAQRIKNPEGLLEGHNELYLKASPPVSQSMLDHGIRIRLLENETPIVDHTIWNSRGSLVSGTIHFEVAGEKEEHDH